MRSILLAICAILFMSPRVIGFVSFDFEQRYLVIPDRYMKDRCFIEHNGEWHCFTIIGSDSSKGWWVPGNEVTFGHISTTDFRRWTIHPDVLGIGSDTWDEQNIWAPDIIRLGGVFRMYYTGVDSNIVQQMGIAESTDLFDWQTYSQNPVYKPDTAWFDWGEGRWSNCRDPDIFYLYDTLRVLHTVSTRDGFGAIDHAISLDGVDWIDLGPIFINDSDAVLESVQLIEQSNEWYLFFNEYGVLGVSVIRAASPFGPWRKDERRVIARGQAQEIFGTVPNTLISRHMSYQAPDRLKNIVKVDSLLWDEEGFPYVSEDNTLWDDWSTLRLDDHDPGFRETGFEVFATDSAFAYQPTFGENPSFRGEAVEIGFMGNSWIGTRERYRGPLTPTEEGGLVGDEAVGGIRTRDFTVTGRYISFYIGGDEDSDRLLLALCDSGDHTVLFSETGYGSEKLVPRYWEMDTLYGREVYIKIVDASPSGHLNVDEIAEHGDQFPPADSPFPGFLFDPYPNPFGLGISLSVRLERDVALVIEIYNVEGKRIKTVFSGHAGRGYTVFHWDGRDGRGHDVASGVFFLRVRADGISRSKKIFKIR